MNQTSKKWEPQDDLQGKNCCYAIINQGWVPSKWDRYWLMFRITTSKPRVFHSVPAGTLLKFAPRTIQQRSVDEMFPQEHFRGIRSADAPYAGLAVVPHTAKCSYRNIRSKPPSQSFCFSKKCSCGNTLTAFNRRSVPIGTFGLVLHINSPVCTTLIN